jgi:hypothetical protein
MDYGQVAVIAKKTLALLREIIGSYHDEAKSVSGDLDVAPFVVPAALFAAMHPGDRQPVGLVEERSRFEVLGLAELDDETEFWPIRIHGEPSSTSGRRRQITE